MAKARLNKGLYIFPADEAITPDIVKEFVALHESQSLPTLQESMRMYRLQEQNMALALMAANL